MFISRSKYFSGCHFRGSKNAVNENVDCNSNSSSSDEDDDSIKDPNYIAHESLDANFSSNSKVYGPCEEMKCKKHVFAACHKCEMLLCWNHFTEAIIYDCIMGGSHNNCDSCNEAGSVEQNATCSSRDIVTTCDNRGRHGKQAKVQVIEHRKSIKDHILSIPLISLHYCRAQSLKQYLSPNLSMAKLYDLYVELCSEQNQECAWYATYYRVFNSLNIAFHSLKKDLCDFCESFKNYNIAEK